MWGFGGFLKYIYGKHLCDPNLNQKTILTFNIFVDKRC